jgi:hypothetical protein
MNLFQNTSSLGLRAEFNTNIELTRDLARDIVDVECRPGKSLKLGYGTICSAF